MLSAIEELRAEYILCRADRVGIWHWAELLEASAQAAGVIASVEFGAPLGQLVVAEFREVAIPTVSRIQGPLWFEATFAIRFLHFHRCSVIVRGASGVTILSGTVTLASTLPDRASVKGP